MACHDYTNKLMQSSSNSSSDHHLSQSQSRPTPIRSSHPKSTLKKGNKARTSMSHGSHKKAKIESADYLAHGTGIPRYFNINCMPLENITLNLRMIEGKIHHQKLTWMKRTRSSAVAPLAVGSCTQSPATSKLTWEGTLEKSRLFATGKTAGR